MMMLLFTWMLSCTSDSRARAKNILYQYGTTLAMYMALFHCSRSLVFPSPFHLLFSPCPQEYAMSNDIISEREGKNNLIFQNSHLAGQLSMFLSTSIQFPIPVSATSLRIDHARRSWNILTGPMSPNSLRDWFHFSIQHPPPPKHPHHSSAHWRRLPFIFPVLGEMVFSLISWIKVK